MNFTRGLQAGWDIGPLRFRSPTGLYENCYNMPGQGEFNGSCAAGALRLRQTLRALQFRE